MCFVQWILANPNTQVDKYLFRLVNLFRLDNILIQLNILIEHTLANKYSNRRSFLLFGLVSVLINSISTTNQVGIILWTKQWCIVHTFSTAFCSINFYRHLITSNLIFSIARWCIILKHVKWLANRISIALVSVILAQQEMVA